MNELLFRIKLLEKNISQNRFASKLGLHPQVLSAIVRGYRVPSSMLKNRMAVELGCSVAELFIQQKKRSK